MVVSELVSARVAGDERSASMCGKPVVVDYFFAMSVDAVRSHPRDRMQGRGGLRADRLPDGPAGLQAEQQRHHRDVAPATDAAGDAWMGDTVVVN